MGEAKRGLIIFEKGMGYRLTKGSNPDFSMEARVDCSLSYRYGVKWDG